MLKKIFTSYFPKGIVNVATLPAFLVFLIATLLKIIATYQTQIERIYYPDGTYYVDVAQNVRDGIGLKTNVSIFAQGMPHFPHPTTIYPLWPLLLGHLGKVFPLTYLSFWLPTAFYFFSIFLAYQVGLRVTKKPLWEARFRKHTLRFHAGHLLATLFIFHRGMFMMTSVPYTEGLAYALLCICFLRIHSLLTHQTWLRSIEVGVWIGLTLLSRSQLVILPFTWYSFLALTFLLRRRDTQLFKLAIGSTLGLLLVWQPYAVFLQTFTDANPLHTYLRFDQYQASSALTPYTVLMNSSTFLEFLLDRLYGMFVAFNPFVKYSFFTAFQLFPLCLLLVLPIWLFYGIRWFARPNKIASLRVINAYALFIVLFALVAAASIHAIHTKTVMQWPFWHRHGFPYVFLFFLATVQMFHSNRLYKHLGIVIVLGSVLLAIKINAQHIKPETLRFNRAQVEIPKQYSSIVQWLNEQSQQKGRFVVAGRTVHYFAPFTPEVGYHAIWALEKFEEVSKLFSQLNAKYLILHPAEPILARFTKHKNFNQRFKRMEIGRDLSGYRVYRYLSPRMTL